MMMNELCPEHGPDFMAGIRTLTSIPEQLVWQVISTLPKNMKRFDIVADTYGDISLKTDERREKAFSTHKSSVFKIQNTISNFFKKITRTK